MARLVWFDPELLVHRDEAVRNEVYFEIALGCGWSKGKMMAEIPNLGAIRRLASDRHLNGISSMKLEQLLIRIKQRELSMRVPGVVGDTHDARALNTALVSFLLTRDQAKLASSSRYLDDKTFFMEAMPMGTQHTWGSEDLQRRLALIAIGSDRIDLVDQYLPLDQATPVLSYFAKVFQTQGEYHRHLKGRPELWLHCMERYPGQVGPNETVGSLLGKMKLKPLEEGFQVVFSFWKKGEHHTRLLIGDIGGLHLGESQNTNGPVNVSSVDDHHDLRKDIDDRIRRNDGFVRLIRA